MLQSDLRYKFLVFITARHAENAIDTTESGICQIIFVGVSQVPPRRWDMLHQDGFQGGSSRAGFWEDSEENLL